MLPRLRTRRLSPPEELEAGHPEGGGGQGASASGGAGASPSKRPRLQLHQEENRVPGARVFAWRWRGTRRRIPQEEIRLLTECLDSCVPFK